MVVIVPSGIWVARLVGYVNAEIGEIPSPEWMDKLIPIVIINKPKKYKMIRLHCFIYCPPKAIENLFQVLYRMLFDYIVIPIKAILLYSFTMF